jgi:hypothetical protein
MENTKLTNSVTTPQTFRVEVEALVIFDVEANSSDEALAILKEDGFESCSQQLRRNHENISWANCYYEFCDFAKAEAEEF